MDSIIHQVQEGQETTSLTPANNQSHLSQPEKQGHSNSGGGGGFLRSLFCCFTGPHHGNRRYSEVDQNDEPKDEPKNPKAPLIPDDPVEPEPHIVKEPPRERPLLPPMVDSSRVCCVIDLDETLVHSSFRPIDNADFQVPVEIDGNLHRVFVLERPHLAAFLTKMGELFECVLFTASLSKYADEVADHIDPTNVFAHRLFREACVYDRGNYVKDLSKLGRDLDRTIIIDNSPASYLFQPQNAIPCSSWFDDKNDTLLQDMIPEMEAIANSSREEFYELIRKVQDRIQYYNQQNSERQIE